MAKQKQKENAIDYSKELAINQGKEPPKAVEFETLILGTCLIDVKGLERAVFLFGENSDIFYDPRHGVIWATIYRMVSKGLPIDLATVIMELKRAGELEQAGGDHYIIDLTMGVSSSAHLEYHARIVMEKYFARVMQYNCYKAATELFAEKTDVFEQLDSLRGVVQGIEDTVNKTRESTSTKDAHAEMLDNYKRNDPMTVVVKYKDLNHELQGFQEGDFVIIGARPSIGKTAVALNFATQTALQNSPVGVFSLEMSTRQLHQRVTANVCDVSFYRLYRKILNDEEITRMYAEGAAMLEKMPLQYDESRNLFQILSKIRIMAKRGVKLIILDYIQIVNTDGLKFGSREQEISFISRSLKSLALELKIVIMALAQVSRQVESRGVKRPTVADLRESGALEQDADIICLLYRPEFYGVKEWDTAWDGIPNQDTKGQIELQFAKYRNGSPFNARMRFWGDKMRLADFNSESDYTNPSRTYTGEDGRKELTKDDDEFDSF